MCMWEPAQCNYEVVLKILIATGKKCSFNIKCIFRFACVFFVEADTDQNRKHPSTPRSIPRSPSVEVQ
jgi:hypothetical protein